MKKLTSLLMLALFLFTGLSMKAQAELGLQVSAAPTTTEGVTVWSEGTKWYKLKMDSGSWRYVETSGSYTNASGKLILTNGTSSNLFTGAWAVVGDDTNGYQFYNMGEGPSKVLGVTGSDGGARTSMVDAATPGDGVTTTFKIVKHTDGKWYIKKHGNNDEYINNRDYYVALWNSSAALGNSGSSFMFEAIEDVSAYATAAQSKLVSRVGMWKKVPAIWAEASAAYNALNAVTLSATVTNAELVTAAAAQKTAGSTFVEAVNSPRVTLSNCSTTPAPRVNSFMYFDSSNNTVKGRNATVQNTNNTLDEVFTLKPCDDITLKIYNATANKYIGKPTGTTSGSTSVVNEVAEAGATAFDIYTSNDFADNSVVFCMNGIASMHLLGGLNVSNYSDNTDGGSRWLLRTDVSRHDLQAAINNATTFKTNLETLVNKLVAAKKISVKPTTLSVTLPTAITKAQNALNNASGTPATRTAAIAPLNAALTKAKGAWLGEFGTAQQFRLKSHTITTTETPAEGGPVTKNYYLTMAQTKDRDNEGNAILAAYNETDVNQIFTLVPGTGANAGKYILVSNSKQLKDLGFWNTDMADAGTPYGFEDVDVANSLFRVRTTQGLLGPNNGVTGADLTGKNKFLYTNQKGTRDNLTWELEFIAPALGAVDSTSLKNIYYSQNFLKNNSINFVNQNSPSVDAYNDVKEKAWQVLAGRTGSTVTQIDVNTAEAELKAAYEQMLNNFISEADPTQGYRLIYYHPEKYTAQDLYMTLNPAAEETHEVNVMQVKTRDASTLQTIQFRNGVDANQFYIIEGFYKLELTESTSGDPIHTWNPALVESGAGKLYTFERVTLEGVDELIVRIATGRGWLGPNSTSPTNGTYVYNDKRDNNNYYWIIKPYVSPDLLATLRNKIYEAKAYEPYVGTGVGKYSTAGGMDAGELASFNSLYLDFINEAGVYDGQEKTNAGVQGVINEYNTNVFPITINQPEVGKLYRIKGADSEKYMTGVMVPDNAETPTYRMNMVKNNGHQTVFQVYAGSDVNGSTAYKLLSFGSGYYVNGSYGCNGTSSTANSIVFRQSDNNVKGQYTLYTNDNKWMYDNGNNADRGYVVDRNGSYAADYCNWIIEEVTWLPVPINTTVGFGTLYSPVPLKGVSSGNYNQDGRLEFYYGVKVNEAGVNKLKLTKLEGDIPAKTGLIVKYKDGIQSTGCVYMEIADTDPEFTADNALTGTLETVATPTPGTVYTLQKPADSPLGFYNFTGANVKGGKAYLHVVDSEAAPMGLVFDFGGETTGVESIEVNTDNQVIYDLSGRRVAKAGKGLYIINGKKVLVK
ncbi:hypothetical protein [Prevotellamassilia timonensis]|uniref:hypothetical protein n=1 Tax=Prevotellamassilia timonensis TaxID=1852370 RepID=UPI001F434740|nr:hypothetical protein [Prevotellamassilia timonensis]MCF2634768.1 hypothetical protein [Prevotellamassilia timonensis]